MTAKAATGIEPKRIDGFNVEGIEIGPDGTSLYIGFRAPYVGSGNNNALICPLLNFETWFGIGSLSNSKSGEARPDRNRIFATDIVGTGANATLVFVGYYGNLRSKLIAWGDTDFISLRPKVSGTTRLGKKTTTIRELRGDQVVKVVKEFNSGLYIYYILITNQILCTSDPIP